MKKILLLFVSLVILAGTALAADSTPVLFDKERTVIVVQTTQEGYPVHYMQYRLGQPFHIPYWNRIDAAERLAPEEITAAALSQLAHDYKADLVVVPVVHTWDWQQSVNRFGWHDDYEIYTLCWYDLTVYAYNAQDGTLKSYSSKGSEKEQASILNDPNDVLSEAMDQIMEKLPYKRIPVEATKEAAP